MSLGGLGSSWLNRAAISRHRGCHAPEDTVGPAGEGSSQVPSSPEQPAAAEQTPGVFEAQDLGEGI